MTQFCEGVSEISECDAPLVIWHVILNRWLLWQCYLPWELKLRYLTQANMPRTSPFSNAPHFLCSERKHPFSSLPWPFNSHYCLQTQPWPVHSIQDTQNSPSQPPSFLWGLPFQALIHLSKSHSESNHHWQGSQCCTGHPLHQYHHLHSSLLRNSQKSTQKKFIQGCGEEEKALAYCKA